MNKSNKLMKESDKLLVENKKKLEELKIKIQKYKISRLFTNTLKAIQDFIVLENLESKILNSNEIINFGLFKENYIYPEDSQLDKDLRINFLIDKIDTMDLEVLNMIENIFPNLINDLKPFLIKKIISNFCPIKDKHIVFRINMWWGFD